MIDIIYVVLIYRNTEDLEDFIRSIIDTSNYSYKVIVVNNYYNDITLDEVKKITNKYNCILLESENKGYSNGNNIGIEFAYNNYNFKYLIVSNPDITINKLNMDKLSKYHNEIIAPEIIARRGRKQNPFYYRYMRFSEWLIYRGFKSENKNKILIYSGIILNKINKNIIRFIKFFRNKPYKIYSAHGCFIIFSKQSLDKLIPIFDENIFLFYEELDLAKNARNKKVNIIYDKNFVVNHKEDGSMDFSDNVHNHLKKSYLYYYDKWNIIKEDKKA